MYAREIKYIDDLKEVLEDEITIEKIRHDILAGDVYIVRRFLPKKQLLEMRDYMIGIGRHSLPNYRKVEKGAPNFHRIDRWDPRAYVKACFHSFSFFPWNQDVFDLFEVFTPIYHLKNLLSNLPPDSFLGDEPDRGCTARISFHYYPRGIGGLNHHQDPFDYHQITVPIMLLSDKETDFEEGGGYIEMSEAEQVNLDEICDFGDVVYFNAQTYHGVKIIDEGTKVDWLSFQGRWIILFAVNKLADNINIGDSKDLGYKS